MGVTKTLVVKDRAYHLRQMINQNFDLKRADLDIKLLGKIWRNARTISVFCCFSSFRSFIQCPLFRCDRNPWFNGINPIYSSNSFVIAQLWR